MLADVGNQRSLAGNVRTPEYRARNGDDIEVQEPGMRHSQILHYAKTSVEQAQRLLDILSIISGRAFKDLHVPTR